MSCYLAMKIPCLLVFLLVFFFACLLAFLFACIQAFVPLRYALMHAQMHEPMHTQHCKPMVIRPICQDKGRRYCRTWCGRVSTWGSAPLSRSWWARGICSSPTSKAWLHTRPSIRTFPCGSGACDCPAPAVLPAPTCAADAHDCGRWDSRQRLWGFLYSSAPRTMHFGAHKRNKLIIFHSGSVFNVIDVGWIWLMVWNSRCSATPILYYFHKEYSLHFSGKPMSFKTTNLGDLSNRVSKLFLNELSGLIICCKYKITDK